MDNNLEQEVKQTTTKNPWLKKLLVTGLIAATAYTGGRFQEAKDHQLYNTTIKKEIMGAALEGYAWKEKADPRFFEYEAKLVKDPENKTMEGHMLKDTIDAGPIKQGGKIGYSMSEKAEQEANKTWETVKDYTQKAAHKTDSLFQESKKLFDKGIEKVKQYFDKDTTQVN